MTIQSEALTKFYRLYLEWTEAGAPAENEYGFERQYALCANSCCTRLPDDPDTNQELTEQFVAAGLDKNFPFGGLSKYFGERNREDFHLNAERMQWVRTHAKAEI